VAKDVRCELRHVRRDDVPAAADQGQGPRGVDEVDRTPRARPKRDVRLDLRQADLLGRPSRGRERDRIVDDRPVDVDLGREA